MQGSDYLNSRLHLIQQLLIVCLDLLLLFLPGQFSLLCEHPEFVELGGGEGVGSRGLITLILDCISSSSC